MNATAIDRGDLSFLKGSGSLADQIRSLDWSMTPLGPPDQWSPTLRVMVRFILANRFPLLLWWGPQYVSIYNDAYRPILGTKHPRALGQPVKECWSEIWHVLQPLIDTPFNGGPATWMEDICLEINRHGFMEETHFTVAYSPVPDEMAPRGIGGVLATVHEITEKVIGERRIAILRDLAAHALEARTAEEACAIAAKILDQHRSDIPFALLYLTSADRTRARLAGAAGIAAGESAVPSVMDWAQGGPAAAAWPLGDVARTESMQLLDNLSARMSQVPPGPWSDPPNTALIVPILSNKAHQLAGFLIAGISARLTLDESYRSFLQLLAAQVATAVATAGAYEEERRRAEALAALDRAKTTFFSNISHEFRTPLTLMLGPLQDMLTDETTTSSMRQRIEVAHRNSLRLLKLVNSLLDFSRLEAGRVEASYEPTDLAALTNDLASTFRSAIERAGLRYQVECSIEERTYIDREMWEQITLNLLSNALKYTFEGEITITLKQEGRAAVLTVRDTGVGVSPAELPRLFERFYRVDGTQGRSQEGSGIGLALVQELVKLHGGTVSVVSTVGQGSTFRVSVPLGSAHLPAERIRATRASTTVSLAQMFVQEASRWIPDAVGEGVSRVPAVTETGMSIGDKRFANTFGARIVLADDNADMRAYLRELLMPHYVIELATDGEEALAAARRERPDLILSDIMMPRLDGLGLLTAIRADQDLHSVPVVLLSARAGEEARIDGLDAGADDYVIKPFSARELLARVGALLELEKMRRRTEDASRRRTEQFQTLLNAAPLGVCLVDADFRIREVNPPALAVIGDIPDLIGRDFDEVIHILWPQVYADELVGRFRDTLETGEPYAMPERMEQRRDRGVIEYYEWWINRIPLPDGRYGVVCYFRDSAEHALARARLEAADRQKDEFLAMLAHELRNPLAPIRNASELLARSATPDARMQVAAILRRQVIHLTRLVDDLLDVSRITQGKIDLKRRPVQLAKIIEQAVETVEPLLKEKQHKVSIVSDRRSLWVHADPTRLLQCVVNVLTNASKYTQPRGDIRIESHNENAQAVLSVADNGVGIAPDLLPHVFDLFVQSDRTLDRAEGGLGIGLSVVKKLLEMHGGSVTATSAGLGCGAVFEIRVPLIDGASEFTFERPQIKTAPRRILVVDDNRDSANSLGMVLEVEGHKVESVYTAQDALERVGSFKPDVVLLDIGLPGMDGYEVARRIRELPGLERVRLVALTGYGQADDKERTRSAGFDGHLVKPVDFSLLGQALTSGDSER
ncbi:MAG: ATP-binding protein [Steroidobacteraceae bacterium]